MKNQVTSIEQSRRLVELGVPEEKASMFWDNSSDRACYLKIWDVDDETKRWEHQMDSKSYVPAFTVADLLEVMPSQIIIANVKLPAYKLFRLPASGRTSFQFQVRNDRHERSDKTWRVGYISTGDDKIEGMYAETVVGENIATLLADRIEWLVSNGYRLNV